MNRFKLILLSLAALLVGRAPGFSTANADDAPVEIPADDSTLARLCRGSGVDIADVRWRIQYGLEPAQAVEAAMAQKVEDARAPQAARDAEKAKAKAAKDAEKSATK